MDAHHDTTRCSNGKASSSMGVRSRACWTRVRRSATRTINIVSAGHARAGRLIRPAPCAGCGIGNLSNGTVAPVTRLVLCLLDLRFVIMAPNNWTSSQLHDRVANALRRSEVLEAAYKTTTVGQLVSMRARTHEASPIPQQKRRAFRYSRKVCVIYEGRCRSSRIPPIPHTYSCWAKDIVRHFNGGTARPVCR